MKMRHATFALALGASVLVPEAVGAAPTIELINPSDYQTVLTISDREDVDSHYHLVAWVGSAPPSAAVEFELRPALGGSATAFPATAVGADTFEATIPSAGFRDGDYRLRAILFSDDSSVAETTENVTLNSDNLPPPPPPETIEIVAPLNGEELGFFTSPGGRATAIIDGVSSEGATQARALYTTSRPGTDPFWRQCGSDDADPAQFLRLRCTLAAGEVPANVTAVALVANQTPASAPAQPNADQSGDAHRVVPVEATPAAVEISPESPTTAVGECRRFVVSVTDQTGRPVVGADVDVHATGPDDSLSFGVMVDPTERNDTDPFGKPTRGHPGDERAINCLDESEAQSTQGDHNVPGRTDSKHIDSTEGTDGDGEFSFALHSDSAGGTEVVAWVDSNANDAVDFLEVTGGAVVGWGQAPPEPEPSVMLRADTSNPGIGECSRMEAVVRLGGAPIANGNVDLHLAGPDASAAFCSIGDGNATSTPDGGGHTGDLHADGTKHAEAPTSGSGYLVFGITSTSVGNSSILAWYDRFDDDVQGGDEAADSEVVAWQPQSPRSLTIEASRSVVRKGRPFTIRGSIGGPNVCTESGDQAIQLRIHRLSGTFRNVATTFAGDAGNYSFRVSIRRTRTFSAVAPAIGVCEAVASDPVKVRVLR